MSTHEISGQTPAQVAKHFLHLLDDVHRIHGIFLEEISALRARVQELEVANAALAGMQGADVVSALPDVKGCAVYLVSMDGGIQGWSGGAAELYGYSVEEIIGRPSALLQAAPQDARGGDGQPSGTALRRRKGGAAFQVYPHCVVILDEKGRAAGRMHMEVPIQREAGKSDGGGGRP